MKRIFIAFALCLVSFQSYAESEMTFKEFGDVVYSEDKSAHFIRYTDTAVNKQKISKALRYSVGTYGDANQFRDACLAKCATELADDIGGEPCGGVVLQYHNSNKATPTNCLFKTLEPTVKSDSKKKRDFYRRICYGGGPGGYPLPDDGSDNETACAMFGKTLVKTASGTIVAPTTCNDGDPYTKANDQACQNAGKTACWDKDSSPDTKFHPWIVGVVKLYDYRAYADCFRVCAINDLCYADSKADLRKYGFRRMESWPDSFKLKCDVVQMEKWPDSFLGNWDSRRKGYFSDRCACMVWTDERFDTECKCITKDYNKTYLALPMRYHGGKQCVYDYINPKNSYCSNPQSECQ